MKHNANHQGPDFDDMSSFFPCEIDDAIQTHINETNEQPMRRLTMVVTVAMFTRSIGSDALQ